MKLLLDTQILLWVAQDSPRLSAAVRRELSDPDAELVFSAVSIWEVAIKSGGRRDDFEADATVIRRMLLDLGYTELAITGAQVAGMVGLPAIHKDPFDRMLLAQAISEGMTLLTADEILARYPGPIRKV